MHKKVFLLLFVPLLCASSFSQIITLNNLIWFKGLSESQISSYLSTWESSVQNTNGVEVKTWSEESFSSFQHISKPRVKVNGVYVISFLTSFRNTYDAISKEIVTSSKYLGFENNVHSYQYDENTIIGITPNASTMLGKSGKAYGITIIYIK